MVVVTHHVGWPVELNEGMDTLHSGVPFFSDFKERISGAGVCSLHTTTATSTRTPQNNSFNEQKRSLCTRVLHIGTFHCRPRKTATRNGQIQGFLEHVRTRASLNNREIA